MGTRCEREPDEGGKELAKTTHLWVSARKPRVKCKLFFFLFFMGMIYWKLFTRQDKEGGRQSAQRPGGTSKGEKSRQAEAEVVCGLREEVSPRNAVSTSSSREGKRKGQIKV